jgi:uncharacterized lipoprotein YehR (DUF1307 family)
MKLKHISTLLLFVFVFSFSGFSQVEDEEVEMFGNFGKTRSLSAQAYDFGVVKNVAEHKITIKNTGKNEMIVGEIFVPKGVGVTVLKRRIKPGETGVIVVIIDPKYMKEGQFQKQVVVKTYTQNNNGTKITLTKTYGFKGQVL